jgi:hypothetical protein
MLHSMAGRKGGTVRHRCAVVMVTVLCSVDAYRQLSQLIRLSGTGMRYCDRCISRCRCIHAAVKVSVAAAEGSGVLLGWNIAGVLLMRCCPHNQLFMSDMVHYGMMCRTCISMLRCCCCYRQGLAPSPPDVSLLVTQSTGVTATQCVIRTHRQQ